MLYSVFERIATPTYFTALLSLVFLSFYNRPMWLEVQRLTSIDGNSDWIFLITLFLCIFFAMNAVLTLLSWSFLLKPISIILILITASANYFISVFGVMIDREMIRNVFETDVAEFSDLITLRLIIHLIVGAAIPIWLILRIRIRFQTVPQEIKRQGVVFLTSLVLIAVIIFLQFPHYSVFFRNNRHVRHMVTPINAIYATSSYLKRTHFKTTKKPIRKVGQDAIFIKNQSINDGKRIVFIMIVGETARAANYSIQGYSRPTSPNLEQGGGIYFSNVSSCGTATAISLPCMFSPEGREKYSPSRYSEGLLDVLAQAGAQVVWRNNNSGCKGTCNRIKYENMTKHETSEYCGEDGCIDEVLLDGIEEILDQGTEPLVLVLHLKGSHGPAYYKRYPDTFRRFTPTCDKADITGCERQSIINTYDNTLLYTDHVIGRVLTLLKARQERNHAALLYVSDHGESLGENNIYLHGLPYSIAPKEQTHVPLYLWLSKSFSAIQGLDSACIDRLKEKPHSHDHLFHSVLGLMNVQTTARQTELDFTATCRKRDKSNPQ
ncbi:MAG: phosphoethanolamine--lipid A transferase [Magnetococcales bacterium]|nr:phosphoethanolamine--lipid A transferase [Magnetococcales bacterium]